DRFTRAFPPSPTRSTMRSASAATGCRSIRRACWRCCGKERRARRGNRRGDKCAPAPRSPRLPERGGERAMLTLPKFESLRPATVDEALAALAEDPAKTLLVAGGTDAVPNLKHGLHE